MADKPLDFDPSALESFDAANTPADALAAFDAATGATCIPPGWYVCRVEAGEYVTTKSSGKPAYRLKFVVTEPAAHAGFELLRYLLLDAAGANRAKAALAPLALRTSADIQKSFPEAGRVIICRVLVAIQKTDPTRNDVERFEVVSDTRTAPPSNPFGVDLDGQGEGGSVK